MKRFNDPAGHYERLGVEPTASVTEIKIAFRRRAMELHPDRNASADATEEFQQLTESYNLLIDSAARMQYDTNGRSVGLGSPPSDREERLRLYGRRFFARAFVMGAVVAMVAAVGLWMAARTRHFPQKTDDAIQSTLPPTSTPSEAASMYSRPEVADNGAAWPTSSGYVRGYPIELVEDYSSVTIVNLLNDSDVFVKMFSLDADPPRQIRTLFVRASDQFTVRTVAAGRYELRYRDLHSGALYRTDPFAIDNQGTKHSALSIALDNPNELSNHTHPISEEEFFEATFSP